MTTRTIVRTPRRRKIWAGRSTILDINTATPTVDDILDQTFTDLGLSNMAGVTVMRVVGRLTLTAWTTGAVTPAYINLRWGLAWLDNLVAQAGDGDGQIPRPQQNGARDTRWYQQGKISGLEYAAPLVTGSPLLPEEHSTEYVDITNMQKQRSADQRFCLVVHTDGTQEDDSTRLTLDLQTMIALP